MAGVCHDDVAKSVTKMGRAGASEFKAKDVEPDARRGVLSYELTPNAAPREPTSPWSAAASQGGAGLEAHFP